MNKHELYDQYINNPKGLEELFASSGYKFLGWQVHAGNCDELKQCHELHHKAEDIQHNMRGSDVTFWCNECKVYWKIDMSD